MSHKRTREEADLPEDPGQDRLLCTQESSLFELQVREHCSVQSGKRHMQTRARHIIRLRGCSASGRGRLSCSEQCGHRAWSSLCIEWLNFTAIL